MDFPNMAAAKTVVLDTETDGLDWKRNKVCGYVITLGPQPSETYYFPIRHGGGNNLPVDNVRRWVDSWIDRPDLHIVGHHLKFDLHMLANEGHRVGGSLEDTEINAALIDENAKSFSLDAVAKAYSAPAKLGQPLYEHLASLFGCAPDKKSMEHFWKVAGDDPIAVDYAKGDGTATWVAWENQQPWLDEEELRDVWNLECRVLRTLFRMERRGVKIDEERLRMVKVQIAGMKEEASAVLPDGFNPRSPLQMQAFLKEYEDEWVRTKPSKKFPDGQPSFPEKWLSKYEKGRAIVRLRQLTNVENSFILPLEERHLFEGRVYPNFNQLKMDDYGVVTGRLSCNDPNMQQVPKRNKELAKIFRSIFIPDEDYVWSANDFSQQEYKIFATYADDGNLIAGYNQIPPVDIHTSVGLMLDVPRDSAGASAKRMNFGMVSGMGVTTMADHLEIAFAESKRLMNLYHARFPGAKKHVERAQKLAKIRGYICSMLGRRRRFPDKRFCYKAGNNAIQMTGADFTKLKMVEIDEYFARQGDTCHMLLQVHDELNWQYPKEDIKGAYRGSLQDSIAVKMMEDFGEDYIIPMPMPMNVDHSIGSNWSVATFGEE